MHNMMTTKVMLMSAGRPSAGRDVEAEESMRDVPGEAALTPEATGVGSSLKDAQPQLQGAHIAHRAWQQARRWQQMCTVVLTGGSLPFRERNRSLKAANS